MHSRLRSNDAVKRSCANVAGTVSIDGLIAGVVDVDVVALAGVAVALAVGVLRLTILAQDIVSVIGRADDCLHWV
jgi:hypothetical protein